MHMYGVKKMTMEYESFGKCLQRALEEQGLSASAAARLVGFRSRNSIFRILSDETSADVDARFLTQLHGALGDSWPDKRWKELERALEIKRIGLQQYQDAEAFVSAICSAEEGACVVETEWQAGKSEMPLGKLIREICREGEISVVICGCCQRTLMTILSNAFNDAGCEGRVNVRHYIDISPENMVTNLLGALPLMSRVWYNARLVEEGHCTKEMAALYRVNLIILSMRREDGHHVIHHLMQCEQDRFVHAYGDEIGKHRSGLLDRCRFQLAALKPLLPLRGGPQDFVDYTQQYARLEADCMILSVKPDVHFNLVPTRILYQAIREGFAGSGIAGGEELEALMKSLAEIHDVRVNNMYGKRRPTHVVYSLPAMERFMRTGVSTDHFFLQRAYTPEERREIVSILLRQMQADPYFNIWFIREDLRAEITLYEGRGVLLMDAYTSYDLHDDHSEALVMLPDFMRAFQRFFMDELLKRMVMSRAESLAALEGLLRL